MRRLTLPCLAAASVAVVALMPLRAEATCQVATKTVAFGVVDVSRGSDSTGEIMLDCDIATSFEIAVSGSGAPGARYMSGPSGSRLFYDVYPDMTQTVPWSDGSGSGAVVTGQSDGETTERFTVYGRVPTQNAVPAGAYSDALTIVVTF